MRRALSVGADSRNDHDTVPHLCKLSTSACCSTARLSWRGTPIVRRLSDVYALYTDERLDFPLMSRIYKSGFTRIPVLRRVSPRRETRAASDPGAHATAQTQDERCALTGKGSNPGLALL